MLVKSCLIKLSLTNWNRVGSRKEKAGREGSLCIIYSYVRYSSYRIEMAAEERPLEEGLFTVWRAG